VAERRPWQIAITARAEQDLDRLDAAIAERVYDALARYADTEHGSVKQLTGRRPPVWSLRVGDYRVLLERDLAAHRLVVARVRHRREVYR
jgi:mRNA-degrading endonuclease RelE of RelBE toxin-antitoxin system